MIFLKGIKEMATILIYDSRLQECLLAGIKDHPHYRRSCERKENTLAIDVAGSFEAGKGEKGGGYKYLMVATLRAVNRTWQESPDEANEEKQNQEKEKEEDTEDVFHPQDPVPEK